VTAGKHIYEDKINSYINITHCFAINNVDTTPILLTPRSRVFLEQLTGSQLVKKFPAFYGTRRFNTVFTSARHLSLS